MTYVWVIRFEDDLFLGYQHRRLLIFRLSVSKMTHFQAISVELTVFRLSASKMTYFGLSAPKMTTVRVITIEDDSFLDYQRRRQLVFWLISVEYDQAMREKR